MIDLSKALDAYGIEHQDHRVPGRPRRAFEPGALLIHHTASNRRNPMMDYRLYTQGREGLPGPVVQAGLGRDNTPALFSDGYSNHAGKASAKAVMEAVNGKTVARNALARGLRDTPGFSANYHLIGIEVDLDGIGEPLQHHRYLKLVDMSAAICDHMGWQGGHATAHKFTTRRKIDIYAPDFPAWATFQADIDQRIAMQNQQTVATVRAPGRYWKAGRWPTWNVDPNGRINPINGAPATEQLADFGILAPNQPITSAWWDEDADRIVLESKADGGTFALAVK